MMLLSNGWCHGLAHDAHNNNIARAKDVLPNICRTQAPGITPGNDGVVPFTAAARCLQRAHTICMMLAVTPALSAFFIPGDLDLDICQSKGPNTSSLWIWRKSVQRLPRYCETLVTCDAAWLQFFFVPAKLAQIHSAVPEIFEAQTKTRAKCVLPNILRTQAAKITSLPPRQPALTQWGFSCCCCSTLFAASTCHLYTAGR